MENNDEEIIYPSENAEINYTPKFFRHCCKAFGYPIVHIEDIIPLFENGVEDIEDTIEKCLMIWNRFFPSQIKQITLQGSQDEQIIDCPVENCSGIIHYTENASVGTSGMMEYGINKLVSGGINMYSGGAFSPSTYGTPFNYNLGGGYSSYQEAFLKKSTDNMGSDYYCFFDEINNKVIYKSAQNKSITVDFAIYDSDVSHISKLFIPKFEDFCRAQLKFDFGESLGMMNSDLPLEFDADTMKSDGKDELDSIYEWMSENSTLPAM